MVRPSVLLLLMLAAASLHTGARAQSAIYRCVDEASGVTTFTDESGRRELAGKPVKCERSGALVATIPGTRPSGAPARPAPPAAEVKAAAAAFPRVEANVQRTRDGERRRILEDELRTEEQRLLRLRTDFNGGRPGLQPDEAAGSPRYVERVQRLQEQIQRSEANVSALKRELALARS